MNTSAKMHIDTSAPYLFIFAISQRLLFAAYSILPFIGSGSTAYFDIFFSTSRQMARSETHGKVRLRAQYKAIACTNVRTKCFVSVVVQTKHAGETAPNVIPSNSKKWNRTNIYVYTFRAANKHRNKSLIYNRLNGWIAFNVRSPPLAIGRSFCSFGSCFRTLCSRLGLTEHVIIIYYRCMRVTFTYSHTCNNSDTGGFVSRYIDIRPDRAVFFFARVPVSSPLQWLLNDSCSHQSRQTNKGTTQVYK